MSINAETATREEHLQTWAQVRTTLKSEKGNDVFDNWLASLEYSQIVNGEKGKILHLTSPSTFLRNWVKKNYKADILVTWQGRDKSVKDVEFFVRSAAKKSATSDSENPASAKAAFIPAVRKTGQYGAIRDGLNPHATFENFVPTSETALAFEAAKLVAGNVKELRYNPLYIYGESDVGKTHVIQAIAHAREAAGDAVSYISGQRIEFSLVGKLKNLSAVEFKMAVDALGTLIIIDDVQYATSRSTLQELLHVLNHSTDRGVQIVVAADRPPSELEGDSARLASRFNGGLVVEMKAAGLAARTKIIQHWMKKTPIQGGTLELEEKIIQTIATNFDGGGRAIQGVLKRIALSYDFHKKVPTIEGVLELCAELVTPKNKRVRVEDILRVVIKHFTVSRADILSSRRTANVVRPRQISMYLAKVLTLKSLPEIGRRFGNRDHTTVLHAVRKIEGLVQNDKELAEEIEVLKRLISN